MVSSDEINKRLNAKRRGVEYREPIRSNNRNTPPQNTGGNFKECPDCHTQNPPTAKFCVGCGKKLETAEDTGFTPTIKGPETGPATEKSEEPVKRVSQRPDDFSTGSQRVQQTAETSERKLEPIVPESTQKPAPEATATPETPTDTQPPEKTPEPPQVKRPESFTTPETSKVKEPETIQDPVAPTETVSSESKEKSDVDPVERIKKAKELLDLGAITQEEYDMIKQKYLDEL